MENEAVDIDLLSIEEQIGWLEHAMENLSQSLTLVLQLFVRVECADTLLTTEEGERFNNLIMFWTSHMVPEFTKILNYHQTYVNILQLVGKLGGNINIEQRYDGEGLQSLQISKMAVKD